MIIMRDRRFSVKQYEQAEYKRAYYVKALQMFEQTERVNWINLSAAIKEGVRIHG